MKRKISLLLAMAFVVSLQAISSQAADLNPLKKALNACVSPQCCEEPACCETACDTAKCCKPICPHCQNDSCMVVCEMKKIKKTVWVIEYEKVAPVNPGCNLLDTIGNKFDAIGNNLKSCTKQGCFESESCCEEDGCCETCCADGCCGKSCCTKCCAPPQCGKARCVKKLVKKEIDCEVPVYKCVVSGCHATCSEGCDESAPVEAPATQPQAAPAPTIEKPAPTPEKEESPVARLRVPVFDRY